MSVLDLNERKKKILQTIIEEYIGTAEPVGSRAISKKNEMGLSSATIRNEMADLEEMGYLVQLHTSSGRVPSDNGYRFYVDSLMKRYQIGIESIERTQKELEKKVNQLDVLIKKASLIAASLTDYTTVITTPEVEGAEVKKIDLISLGTNTVMLIVVTKTGVVRNQVINIDISEEMLARLTSILNARLCNISVNAIDFNKIEQLQREIQSQLNLQPKVLISILNFVYETIEMIDTTEIYIDNAKAILKYPEFNSVDKARDMLAFLEDKKNIRSLMFDKDDKEGVNIKIGTENKFKELHNSSLVTVDYSLGNNVVGKIGVIGPKRMDYAKVIASLDCISENIDKILYQLFIE